MLPPSVIVRGTAAVANFNFRKPNGATESGQCLLARRDGGWLVVIDPFLGGGLTDDELQALEPLVKPIN